MPSLLLLSVLYFLSYLGTGLAVKFCTGSTESGFMGLSGMQYSVYSTAFSSLVCVAVVLFFGWQKRGKLKPTENITLLLSGLCTAFIIPASTLIMALPISVMVALVLMRVSVIVASRLIDAILNAQGYQHKKISWQENAAVLLAIAAVAIKMVLTPQTSYHFSFGASVLITFYFLAYLIRLYIMNRAKLKGIAGAQLDQRLYFGVEQLYASTFLFVMGGLFFLIEQYYPGSTGSIGKEYFETIALPHASWVVGSVAGLPYAFVAFFSVFLFLYPGKSATFTGVTNRLVSLLGGAASSLVLFFFFEAPFPPREDWAALGFILAAIMLLAYGGRRRAA